jgi:starch phosphorylase
VELFERLLPRHLEIIYEINPAFLRRGADALPRRRRHCSERLSIIDEAGRAGAHGPPGRRRQQGINGVAALHSELLKSTVMRDFAEMWPEKFTNVTNGVTPRRFMAVSNPELTG